MCSGQPEYTHQGARSTKRFHRNSARSLTQLNPTFATPPKHGSWLNIAENELSSLTRQSRILSTGDFPMSRHFVRKPMPGRPGRINATQRGVDWQMKIDDAHCKLTSVYPKIKL